jgi:hypothetical protein
MTRTRRILVVLAGAAALVLVFVLVRNGDDENEAAQPTPTQPAPTPTEPGPTAKPRPSPKPKPTPAASRVVMRIPIRGGQVPGGLKRVSADKGQRVLVVVSSDGASDEVHLHGYDLSREVAPGAPARIAFRATIVGRFEVELEDRGLQIGELEVRP